METVLKTVKGSYVDFTFDSAAPEGGYQEGLVPVRINSNTGLYEIYDYDLLQWRNVPSPISSLRMIADTAGTAVVDNGLVNRIVNAVSIGDIYKVTGFTKPYASNTITFTDGSTIAIGDVVLAIFL